MHRIDGPGHQSNLFTEGDQSQGITPTVVTDDWLNAVQEEIVAVLTAAGISPVKADNAQLAAAIAALIPDMASNAEALAGTDLSKSMSPKRVHEAFQQFGLGRAGHGRYSEFATSVDPNLITVTQLDYPDGASPNLPIAEDGILQTFIGNSTGGVQFFFGRVSKRCFFRHKAGTASWQSWAELYHSANSDVFVRSDQDDTLSGRTYTQQTADPVITQHRIANTGDGDAGIYLDGSDGDFSGGDYARVVHRLSDLALLLECFPAGGGIDLVDGGNGTRINGNKVWHSGDAPITLAAAGEVTLPNGLIIKWGSLLVSPNNVLVNHTFPIAFPNAFLSMAQFSGGGSSSGNSVYLVSTSSTGFSVRSANGASVTMFYIAMGY